MFRDQTCASALLAPQLLIAPAACALLLVPRLTHNAVPFLNSGKKNDPISANDWIVRKIPGVVLLSHSQIYSTIAAGALNYRVREGNVCDSSAMDTGKKSTIRKCLEVILEGCLIELLNLRE